MLAGKWKGQGRPHGCFETMYSSSLIRNSLLNNNLALINVVRDSLNLNFTNKNYVTVDYLLKLVKENKVARDVAAENLYDGVARRKQQENFVALM